MNQKKKRREGKEGGASKRNLSCKEKGSCRGDMKFIAVLLSGLIAR